MTNDILGSTNTLGAPNFDGTLATGLAFENPLTPNLKFLGTDRVGSFLNGLSSNLVVQDLTAGGGLGAALPGNTDPLIGGDRVRRDNYNDELRAALIRFGYKGLTFTANEPSAAIVKIDPLTGSRTVNGRISDDVPVVSYELGIRDTSTLSATVSGLKADADLSLWQDRNNDGLFEPDEELDFSEEEGNASEAIVRNLFPGKYFLDVYQFEGNTDFKLDLKSTPVVTPAGAIGLTLNNATNVGALSGTDARNGTLAPGKNDLYRFSLTSDRDFGLFLNGNSAPATLELFRDLNNNNRLDTGEMLQATTAPVGQTGEIYFPQQVAGTYFARVTSGANTAYKVAFEALGSSRTGNETIETVSPGQTVPGILTNTSILNPTRAGGARSQDFLLNDVVGNQRVDITVAGRNGFDAAVQVIDEATGKVVVENDNSSPNTKNAGLSFTTQPDTDYTVRVTSFATGNSALGDFSVTVTGANPVVGSLGLGQNLGGSLSTSSLKADGAYRADYNLTGLTPGQSVQISLNSGAFDAYLEIIDTASGLVVADNDDISFPSNVNSQLTFTPAAGRTYLARVSTSLENQTGAFTLSATPSSNAVQRARPSLNSYLGFLKSAEVRSAVETRAADEVLDRNDYLAVYQVMANDGTIDNNEEADLALLGRETDAFTVAESTLYLARKVADRVATSETLLDGEEFINRVVGTWFRGAFGPAATFTDTFGGQNEVTTFTYQGVQGTLYGSKGEPVIGDLAQDPFSNCYYIAALGSTFGREPIGPSSAENPFRGTPTSKAITDAITDNGDRTYTVRFFNNNTGRAEYVTVNQSFITTNEGKIAGSTRTQDPSSPDNVLWPVVMERAYAQWLGGYTKVGNGGSEAEAQGQIVGGKAQRYTNDASDERGYPAYTFEIIKNALASDRFATASTPKKAKLLFGNHAYTVTDAFEEGGQQYVVVYNPHGKDNGGSAGVSGDGDGTFSTAPREDGFIKLTYQQFQSEIEDFAVL